MALTDKIIRIIKNGVGCLVLAATLYAQDFTISYNKIIQNAKLEKVYCNALLFSKNDAICGDIYSILFFKCKDKSYFFFRFSDDFKEIKEIQYSTNINFFVKEKNINYNSKVLLKYKIPTEIFQVEADALWFENNRKHEFNINYVTFYENGKIKSENLTLSKFIDSDYNQEINKFIEYFRNTSNKTREIAKQAFIEDKDEILKDLINYFNDTACAPMPKNFNIETLF